MTPLSIFQLHPETRGQVVVLEPDLWSPNPGASSWAAAVCATHIDVMEGAGVVEEWRHTEIVTTAGLYTKSLLTSISEAGNRSAS